MRYQLKRIITRNVKNVLAFRRRKLLQINEPCEEEHMEKIACIFMFVNNKNYIETTKKWLIWTIMSVMI